MRITFIQFNAAPLESGGERIFRDTMYDITHEPIGIRLQHKSTGRVGYGGHGNVVGWLVAPEEPKPAQAKKGK